ncbi:MAG: protein kinase domain-containing protein [Paraclostridium sp.]
MIYIDKYEVLEEIGRGCRCSLFKCRDIYNGQIVTISIIDNDVDISNKFISNLIDETIIINEVDSPYILSINDVGTHQLENGCELYYTVSDYIEGNTLDELNMYHTLNIEEIVSVCRQILSGLEVAHSYDIYHGYLQPSNIIIDEGYNVKISNLGIIKSNNKIFNNSINKIYQDLRYLSPQQICLGYSDKSSDFFSIGIMLFELIFKDHPFGIDEDPDEMLKNIDKGINWNNFDTEDVHPKLIHIINKLLSRKNKYRTPREVIIDFSEYIYEMKDIENKHIETHEEDINEYVIEKNPHIYKKRKLIRIPRFARFITLAFLVILGIIIQTT